MARITYNTATIGGAMVAEAVDHIRKARDLLVRAVSVANSISSGGATPVPLEGSPEFGVATGQGAAFYAAVNSMKTNAATVTDVAIAELDNG
jgi:hypothetical protein